MKLKNGQDQLSGYQHKDLATLIDSIRLRNFPQVLVDFLATLCHFDSALIVTYKKSLKPIMIYPTDPAEQSPTLHNYLEKAFILDPLFNAIQKGLQKNVTRLAEIAPDAFDSSEYYQTCYKKFDLVDEINLAIELNEKVTLTITLGRKTHLGTITRAEMQRLQDMFPIISALVRQFWLSQSKEYVQYEKSNSVMKQALKSFAVGVLTRREQEISGLILQGHSSKVIANQLNISLGTVKVHRKNIHTKLNTSTQSEIFTLFLSHLNELDS